LTKEKEHLPYKVGDFILPSQGQDFQLLKDLMRLYPAITSFRSLRDKIMEWKNKDIEPAQAIEETYNDTKGNAFFYAAAYRDYEKRCREQGGWVDFDGLIKDTVKLLESNDAVRSRYQRKYISVDECQDTNAAQFRLLQLIYGGNIFAVGDENQSVFEFRSAVVGNLTNFSQHFPGTKTLYLGANYRSTKNIVEFVKKITPVDNGIASHMVSMREQGTKPTFIKYDSDLDEAVGILDQIKDLNNTAIIARTNRQLHTFQKVAMGRGIKSMVLGQKDFWQKEEVKHLLDLAKRFKDSGRPAYEVLEEQMRLNNLTHVYRNTGGPNEKPPVENLTDVVKMAAKRGSVKEFLDWFRKLAYACEAAKSPSYEHRSKNPVLALSTVHQMKGRQAKHVYVIGVNEGLMPHKDGEIMEERRIFFVAASRAADKLQISYWGNRSQFLNDFQEEIKYEQIITGQTKEPTPVESTASQASGATLLDSVGR
jgi:DNA helicase II / ATP-dependent DNA helicase PcrA